MKSCSKFQSNIKNSLYLAGKYVDICPRISSVARCKQFSESEADNVRAQISIHIFAQIEAIMFIILQIFCNAREKCVRTAYSICSGDVFFWVLSGSTLWTKKDFPSSVTIPNPLSSWIKFDTKTFPCGRKVLNCGISLGWSWGIFGHVLRSDQSRASKKYLMDHYNKYFRKVKS